MRKYIARVWASVNGRSSRVLESPRSMDNDLQEHVSGQPVHGDGPLDIGGVTPSHDVAMLSIIDGAPNGSSSAVPASDRIQGAGSSLS